MSGSPPRHNRPGRRVTFPNAGTPQCCVASARVEAGVRTGGCLCGAVRYSVRGDPVHVRRCHCADCRKESGSAFSVYAKWPVEAFEMSGEISSYDGRGFCPRCGSRLLDTADSSSLWWARVTCAAGGDGDDWCPYSSTSRGAPISSYPAWPLCLRFRESPARARQNKREPWSRPSHQPCPDLLVHVSPVERLTHTQPRSLHFCSKRSSRDSAWSSSERGDQRRLNAPSSVNCG